VRPILSLTLEDALSNPGESADDVMYSGHSVHVWDQKRCPARFASDLLPQVMIFQSQAMHILAGTFALAICRQQPSSLLLLLGLPKQCRAKNVSRAAREQQPDMCLRLFRTGLKPDREGMR
jgi:hypothetical protein